MSDRESNQGDRFWFENRADDFPFYAGTPIALAPRQWGLVLASLLASLVLLSVPGLFGWGLPGHLVAGVSLCVLPLVVLACVAGRHWSALLRPVTVRSVLWMLCFALLTFATAVPAALVSVQIADPSQNAILDMLAQYSTARIALVLLAVLPQLVGEELLTILPFLAALTWLHRHGMARKPAVLAAWLGSCLLFALLHLPAYGWNVVQCLLVMGSARLVLTLAYLKTRNLWVSTGAHALVDWAVIGAWAAERVLS